MKLILAVAMLFTAFGVNAQTEKGKMLAGGNLGFNFGTSKVTFVPDSGDKSSSNGPKTTAFSFTPNIGYFFIDNLAGGLKLNLSSYSEKSKVTIGTTEYDDKSNSFIFNVGPFLRYYYGLNDNMKVFGEGFFGFGVDNSKYETPVTDGLGNVTTSTTETKVNGTGFEVGPGLAYFINENIGVEALLTYSRFSSKYDITGGKMKNATGDVKFKVGLQIHL